MWQCDIGYFTLIIRLKHTNISVQFILFVRFLCLNAIFLFSQKYWWTTGCSWFLLFNSLQPIPFFEINKFLLHTLYIKVLFSRRSNYKYRVFIKYCVFRKFLYIFRTLASLGVYTGLYAWTTKWQVEHQRYSRTGRVKKNHNILRKKTIFNEHPVPLEIPKFKGFVSQKNRFTLWT